MYREESSKRRFVICMCKVGFVCGRGEMVMYRRYNCGTFLRYGNPKEMGYVEVSRRLEEGIPRKRGLQKGVGINMRLAMDYCISPARSVSLAPTIDMWIGTRGGRVGENADLD